MNRKTPAGSKQDNDVNPNDVNSNEVDLLTIRSLCGFVLSHKRHSPNNERKNTEDTKEVQIHQSSRLCGFV